MRVEDYSDLAIRTAKRFDDPKMTYLHGYLGVTGEFGELCDAIKRHQIYGRPLDLINLGEELGDLLWYVNYMMREVPSAFDAVSFGDGPLIVGDRADVGNRLFRELPSIIAGELAKDGIDMSQLDVFHMISIGARALQDFPLPGEYETDRECADQIEGGVVSVLGFVCCVCAVFGLDYAAVLEKNIRKLEVRYPDLFDSDRAVQRDEQAERKVLE